MQKAAMVAVVLVVGFFSSVVQTQIKKNPCSNKWIVHTSAGGAIDLVDMFTKREDPDSNWDEALRCIDEIKFYQSQLEPNPNANQLFLLNGNRYDVLRANNVFHTISLNPSYGMKPLSLEVAAIRGPHYCLNSEVNLRKSGDDAIGSAERMLGDDGNFTRFYIDNATNQCRQTIIDAAQRVSSWIKYVSYGLPNRLYIDRVALAQPYTSAKFCEVEPYPLNKIEDHIKYLRYIDGKLKDDKLFVFDCYILDVDIVKTELEGYDLAADFKRLHDATKALNMKLGIIINGENSTALSTDNDEAYFQGTKDRLAKFKKWGILDLAEIITFQSWAQDSKAKPEDLFGKTIRPRNLPVWKPNTATNFLMYGLLCDNNQIDCNVYPMSRTTQVFQSTD